MKEPLYIAKSEADRDSDLFKRTVAKANKLGVDVVHVKPEDLIMTRAHGRAGVVVLGPLLGPRVNTRADFRQEDVPRKVTGDVDAHEV